MEKVFDYIEQYPVRAFLIVTFTLIVGGGGLFYVCNRWMCGQLQRASEIETKYDLIAGGCFVKTAGGWIPETRWRGVTE